MTRGMVSMLPKHSPRSERENRIRQWYHLRADPQEPESANVHQFFALFARQQPAASVQNAQQGDHGQGRIDNVMYLRNDAWKDY